MGEAKRRKALDPNYGKVTVDGLTKSGIAIFPEQFLNDYYQFRFFQFSNIVNDPSYGSNRLIESIRSLWDIERVEDYIEKLEDTLRIEFVAFLSYIFYTKMGAIFLKGIEKAKKRKTTEEDLFVLWLPLLMGAMELNSHSA